MVEALLKPVNGIPTIHINGKPYDPILMFGRLDIISGDHLKAYHSEFKKASAAGFHLHTMFLFLDTDISKPDTESNQKNRAMLRELLEIDPNAYLLPRCLVPYDHTAIGMPESENELFSDGQADPRESYIRSDFVSDIWREHANLLLARFIRSVMHDEILCEHVIGYHFSGGETGEWFQRRYHSGVVNVSAPNTRNFRRWLGKKYKNSVDLSRAWKRDVTLDTAEVPADLPGCKRAASSNGILDFDGSQRFIDYLDYFSDEICDVITQGAATVKRETGGKSLFVSFYGYHLEIPGAYSGHFSLEKLLKCPEVDILTSPVAYADRNEGGIGAYMSEASSVISAGKLWLDESDYRIPSVTVSTPRPDVIDYIKSMEASREVILREYGKLALIGAGTWWMDLFNTGWFDNDTVWQYISEGYKYYKKMREYADGKISEICFIIDEKAMSKCGDTWSLACDLLKKTRDIAYKAGVSFDFRLLGDFLSGKADLSKLFVFLNPFRISKSIARYIRAHLEAVGASALWLFGFGSNADKSLLKELTGFDFAVSNEIQNAVEFNGKRFDRIGTAPLTVPLNGTSIGKYGNGQIAFASNRDSGYKSYFFGGTYIPAEILRFVASESGASVYSEIGDCFNKIGRLALLHTGVAGNKALDFKAPVTEITSGKHYHNGKFTAEASKGQTFLFVTDK